MNADERPRKEGEGRTLKCHVKDGFPHACIVHIVIDNDNVMACGKSRGRRGGRGIFQCQLVFDGLDCLFSRLMPNFRCKTTAILKKRLCEVFIKVDARYREMRGRKIAEMKFAF